MPYSLRGIVNVVALALVCGAHAFAQPCFEWLPGNGVSAPPNNANAFPTARVTTSVVHQQGDEQTLYIATSPGGSFPPNMGDRFVHEMRENVFYPLGPDFVGSIECLGIHDGSLYAGGAFTNKIVRWDGNAWIPLPPLPDQGNISYVGAICSYQNRLTITYHASPSSKYVASLEGEDWIILGSTTNPGSRADALHVYNGDLIVGGDFNSFEGNPSLKFIVRYDGTSWHPMLTTLVFDGAFENIKALITHNGELIVGGSFRSIDGVQSKAVIRWNGSEWLSTGGGVPVNSYRCYSLASVGGALYQTGEHWYFSVPGCAGNFSRWTGGSWESPAGCLSQYDFISNTMIDGYGFTLAALGDRVIVGGDFLLLGSEELEDPLYRYENLAAWDGVNWESATGSTDIYPLYVTEYRGRMYAAGSINQFVTPLYSFNGEHWKRIPPQPPDVRPDDIIVLESHDDLLYAGGHRYDDTGPRIAAWNESTWTSPKAQPNNAVYTLASIGADLYVGGAFTMIDVDPFSRIARWDGNNWHTMGPGLSAAVSAIAPFQGSIYAGGSFTNSAGTQMRAIAKWNGVEWSEVGGGLTAATGNPYVLAMAEYQNSLYVGGLFNSAGGAPATNLARWDGAEWSAVPGPVLNNSVTAMHVAYDSLFIGGQFNQTYNSQALANIARFDGTDWHALDTGISGYSYSFFYAIKHLGPTLFIAGGIRGGAPQPRGEHVLRWGYDPIPGDADADGAVTMADITTTLSNFNTIAPPGGYAPGDADHNLKVNFADITAILLHYGAVCP